MNGPGRFEEVHGRSDFQFPQLEMTRPDLTGIPELELPDGYTIRHYRPGDETAWGELMTEAFTPYWDAARFQVLVKPHFGFKPERVLFVCRNGEPIGSACAFQWPGVPRKQGYIHMVGVKKEHCGRRLGYWLAVACLHQFKKEGFQSVMLQTEDFRIPAIKHYLRLGFKPVLIQAVQRGKWERVLERIGGPELGRELNLATLPVMGRFAFWWRTTKIVRYMRWLTFKAELKGLDKT